MKANELVNQVKSLPMVSQTALNLVAMLDKPEVDNDDVVAAVKYDSVLTAKLLRACNSSYLGLKQPVASMEQAVLVLGHSQILRLVLSLTFGGTMSAPLPGYAAEAQELWRHSLTVAFAAEALARSELRISYSPSVAFTAGLLHDIGKLVFSQVLTEERQTEIRAQISRNQLARIEAERQVLGTDHSEVGARLLENWRVPEEIVEAVANHHQPVCEPEIKLSAVIHVADCLAHLVGSTLGWDDYAIRVSTRVNDLLGIDRKTLETLLIALQGQAVNIERFMNLT
jgi:putative nucleotidyltransferase with HDIG domain